MTGLLRSHPRLNAAAKTILSSEEAIRQARAAYLPTVKLAGDTGPEYIDNKTRSTTNDSEPWFRNRDSASVTVTQKLYDGNATDSQVSSARLNRDVSATTLRSTRQEILLEAATAYINVKRWSRQVEFAGQKESNIQGQLALEDERVRRGSGIALDVVQAKQRLQRAKEDRVRAEGELENAVTRYTQVFGHPPQVGLMQDVEPPAQLLPPDLDLALEIAGTENPTLANAELSIEINAERRRLAEAGYYPTIDLVGKANYEDNKNLTLGVRRDWSLLLQGNWEIFSGFKTDAAVSQAAHDYAASRDQRLYTGRKVIEATKIAWRDMTTARDRLDLLSNAVDLAYEMVDGMRKQREAGKVTVREVLDQETALYDAQITYNEAFQDMRLAMYRLLWSIGRLEVEDLARSTSQLPSPDGGEAATENSAATRSNSSLAALQETGREPDAAPLRSVQSVAPEPVPDPVAPMAPQPSTMPVLPVADQAAIPDEGSAAQPIGRIEPQGFGATPSSFTEAPVLIPPPQYQAPAPVLIPPQAASEPAPVLIPPPSMSAKPGKKPPIAASRKRADKNPASVAAVATLPAKARLGEPLSPLPASQAMPETGVDPAPLARTSSAGALPATLPPPAEGSTGHVLGGGLGFGR